MEKEFVPYKESLDLKNLGFDEPCMSQWNGSNGFDGFGGNYRNSYFNYPDQIAAPLYQQAFNWFIVNHNLYGDILPWSVKKLVDDKLVEKIVWYYSVEKLGKPSRYKPYEFTGDTPEEAKLECLKKLIEVIKEKS